VDKDSVLDDNALVVKEVSTVTEQVDSSLWLDMAYDMATTAPEKPDVDEDGNIVREPTTKWLARKYNLSPAVALGIITHPKFTEFIHGMQKAIAKLNFDRKAFNVLDDVMDQGNHRDRLSAVKLAAELLGYKASGGININVKFDEAVRKADQGEVIDVEVFPGF